MLPFRQQILILIVSGSLLMVIIYLIQKRRMLELYSVVWFLISILSISCLWLYPFVVWLTEFIGAGFTSSTILFIGVFMGLLLNMQLCVKLTELTHRQKDLIQEITLLQNELSELRRDHNASSS